MELTFPTKRVFAEKEWTQKYSTERDGICFSGDFSRKRMDLRNAGLE